jgi:hypothetical protein
MTEQASTVRLIEKIRGLADAVEAETQTAAEQSAQYVVWIRHYCDILEKRLADQP